MHDLTALGVVGLVYLANIAFTVSAVGGGWAIWRLLFKKKD